MIINAEKIKIKGVSLFKKILETYDEVIVNYRGENKYAIMHLNRYIKLEDYQIKDTCRKKNPQFIPKVTTSKYLKERDEKNINYEKKIDNLALKMRTNKEVITATFLKTKGISIITSILRTNKVVEIKVSGKSMYIAMKIEQYKELLRMEQNTMYKLAVSKEGFFNITSNYSENTDTDEFIDSLINEKNEF